MSAFPKTSLTLIAKIRNLPPGKDEAAWARFWNLYAPVMRRFAAKRAGEAPNDEQHGGAPAPDGAERVANGDTK